LGFVFVAGGVGFGVWGGVVDEGGGHYLFVAGGLCGDFVWRSLATAGTGSFVVGCPYTGVDSSLVAV
jgi:hypothetical protein